MKERYIVSAVVLLSALAGAAVAPAVAADAAPSAPAVQAADGNASVDYTDQQAADNVTVESATLPEGGFVVVYNESGAPVGHTEYLDAGAHENLTVDVSPAFERSSVSVAQVHRDNGSDGTFDATADGAYTRRGAAVGDTAFLTVGDSARPTTTTADTGSGSETTADATTASGNGTGSDTPATETTGPGFGALLAVAALAAAGLLAARR